MKRFFQSLPLNVINCFKGKVILWHLLAIVLSIGCVVSGFDWRYFMATRNPTLQAWMFPAVPVGGLMPILVPLALLAIGRLITNPRIKLTGWAIGQAALMGSLISSGYKSITGRAHPLRGPGVDLSHVFHFGFLRGGIFWGWPSSHTTIAFAIAGALYKLFPERRWLGVGSFAYAFYIGTGVSITIHWFSDFAAGAILGTVIGVVVGSSFRGSSEMTSVETGIR